MKLRKVELWNPQTEFKNPKLQLAKPRKATPSNMANKNLDNNPITPSNVEKRIPSPDESIAASRVPDNVIHGSSSKGDGFEPLPDIKPLTAKDFPHAFVATVVGSRRTGKTTLVESLLNEMKTLKRFDTYFLFSPTGAGFEGIPENYKYKTLDVLPAILKKQQEVTKMNLKATSKKDHIKSSVCIILDDMLATNELKNSLLTKISLNGRHLNSKDPVSTNELATFILSQTSTGIPKAIRRNSDIILCSRIPSKNDRKCIIEENMILDSSRGGITRAYQLYDKVSLENDFAFIGLLNHLSNKNSYEKYVRSYVATLPKKPVKLFGDKADWETPRAEYDF